jgi:hypothetical protein
LIFALDIVARTGGNKMEWIRATADNIPPCDVPLFMRQATIVYLAVHKKEREGYCWYMIEHIEAFDGEWKYTLATTILRTATMIPFYYCYLPSLEHIED